MTQQYAQRTAVRTNAEGARNATLEDLATILQTQQERKLDVIAPASALDMRDGNLVIRGVEPHIQPTGVVNVDGTYRPTDVADEGFADKLKIPTQYLRRLRAEHLPLYDLNVNGWLEQEPERRFLVRALRSDAAAPGGEPGEGVARAFLSDSYRLIDNFDLLLAALDGIRQSGHAAQVTGCDLTDRRMYVRVESDEVAVQARELLKGYRSPYTGQTGDELPLISAGFVIRNSEVGAGAFTITPRAVVQVCTNGLTMTEDVMREVHLGGKQDDGVIQWSGATQSKVLELITAKTTDAVRTFLSRDFVEGKLRGIEAAAGRPVANPTQTIEHVTKKLNISGPVKDRILAHFIQGRQITAGGVMQAITAAAQQIPNADASYDLEALALPALRAAAAYAA
ncbi:DUF932 domain-containing protein [Streptomyces lunaelactis]|uniref:DUF932 domain-containing protein n=2 Tax=Streptomyces lunaelactis TaxID=1535768 RepID=A0A2R4SVJ3_9ACTN|nr:DUF932 domain-containing protein [Streptomyces lunaelactis]NUK28299.1 DUF932 domain-containing protein [Streptomyces lunaelactis]NUK89971.1 DUF932 domain-containing protein [Streptomyces lunaelactis]